MNLWQIITEIYPELTDEDFHPQKGKIKLQDDGDGISYIAVWNYKKVIPEGLKIGK